MMKYEIVMIYSNFLPFYGYVKTVYFIGIGGIGISAIAKILILLGINVSGSDLKINNNIQRLISLGANINIGHNAENIFNIDIIVKSSAIMEDNPELIVAKKKGIKVISRANMLAAIMHSKYGIVVLGSHGKTTTSSLVVSIMSYAKLDPTFMIGGILNSIGSNAYLGEGNFVVAECDESDGSFINFDPNNIILTNIDNEHLEFWGNRENLESALICFVNRLSFPDFLIACVDCENVLKILPYITSKIITYSIHYDAEFKAVNISFNKFFTDFTVIKNNKILGNVHINLIGEHNVLNTLASIALCDGLGIPFNIISQGLDLFIGIQRRFQLVGKKNNILVIDDYGHHPTEIRAVIKAASLSFLNRRLIVLFQPHRFSRTKYLFEDFALCFQLVDVLIITDIYSVLEKNIYNIKSSILCRKIKYNKITNVIYGGNIDNASNILLKLVKSGDLIITLGAGSISKVAKYILTKL